MEQEEIRISGPGVHLDEDLDEVEEITPPEELQVPSNYPKRDLVHREPKKVEAEKPQSKEKITAEIRLLGDAICMECGLRLESSAATAERSGPGFYRHPWHAPSNQSEKCRLAGRVFAAPKLTIEEV